MSVVVVVVALVAVIVVTVTRVPWTVLVYGTDIGIVKWCCAGGCR